jgi:hypothetical protein
MSSRAFRPIAALLSILLLAGAPVHAGPVSLSEVIQVVGRYQNPLELRLSAVSQTVGTPVAGSNGATRVNSQSATSQSNSADSLLSGVAMSADEPRAGIEVVEEADLEGTICDCGEILLPGGGLPKWPLLFLAGIPLIFIHSCDTCETSTPTPTPPGPTPTPPAPTPTPPPQVPEPASLLLFGSGLVAFAGSLRRRRAKGKLTAQRRTTEEG